MPNKKRTLRKEIYELSKKLESKLGKKYQITAKNIRTVAYDVTLSTAWEKKYKTSFNHHADIDDLKTVKFHLKQFDKSIPYWEDAVEESNLYRNE